MKDVFKVNEVMTIKGRGTYLIGECKTDKISVGDEFVIKTSYGEFKNFIINGIEQGREKLEQINEGQICGLIIDDIESDINVGDILKQM